MSDQPTHSDVTYYDQLGVGRTASIEEIRKAYKCLVRLLHPDHQTDPELKEAAEGQLRRLNRIHAVLCDPVHREAYDQFLLDEIAPPIVIEDDDPKLRLRKLAIRGAFIGGGLLSLVFIFWLGAQSSPGDSSDAPARKQTQGKAVDAESLRNQLAQATQERDQARAELAQFRALSRPAGTAEKAVTPAPKPAQSRPFVPVMTELPASNANLPSLPGTPPVATSLNPETTAPIIRKLSGLWLYVPPKGGQKNESRFVKYVPEFIEITIKEENGLIRGKYRARYKVPDQPISPDVNFEFSGKSVGGTCACNWNGIGGARGTITLALTGENQMKCDWLATEQGQQGLLTGTAVLVRRE